MSWQIIRSDCVEAMRRLDDCSVDAVVTDPPYGLEFMGRDWDRLGPAVIEEVTDTENRDGNWTTKPFGGGGQRVRYGAPGKSMQDWHEAWATEALRVLKPGGHLLAFGGTRTYHRLACAVEDAGFEIRDSIAYVHSIDFNDRNRIMEAWLTWPERAPNAGLTFHERVGSSAAGPVLLATNHDESPASALIAELASSEHRLTEVEAWRSALSPADAPTTVSSALVSIADEPPANPAPTLTDDSSVPAAAPGWLVASTEARIRAAEALRIWLGSEPSSKPAATDALCAALTDALRHITCAHSRTFQSYDTSWRTVCASATTATTTASTAASLLEFTAATLAQLDAEGGDAREASYGPLIWAYGSGFP